MRTILALLLSCLPVLAQFPSLSVQNAYVTTVTNNPVSVNFTNGTEHFLLYQNFEGTGYDNNETWTEGGTGTINEDYTGVVLAGSQSLRVVGTSTDQAETSSPTFANQSELWVYFLFRPVTFQGSGFKPILLVRDSAGVGRWECTINSDGTVRIASTGVATSVGSMTAGTTYHIWAHVNPGSVWDVAFSSTGVRPTSGNNFVSISGGDVQTGTDLASRIMLERNSGTSDHEYIFDKVIADDVQIGDMSNPIEFSAVSTDNIAEAEAAEGAALDYTFNQSEALVNGYIVSTISIWDDDADIPRVTGVTWDQGGANTAMTLLGSVTNTPGFGGRAHVWMYGVAVGSIASGNRTIRVAWSDNGTSRQGTLAATSYHNVHQTTSTGTFTQATGNSTTPSVNVSSAAGQLVIDGTIHYNGASTPGAGQTERWDNSGDTDGAGSEEAGASSVTMSWTITSSDWGIVAGPLKPL